MGLLALMVQSQLSPLPILVCQTSYPSSWQLVSEVFSMSVLVFKMFLKYFLRHTARYLEYSTLVCGVKDFSELPVPVTKSPTACKDDLMLR